MIEDAYPRALDDQIIGRRRFSLFLVVALAQTSPPAAADPSDWEPSIAAEMIAAATTCLDARETVPLAMAITDENAPSCIDPVSPGIQLRAPRPKDGAIWIGAAELGTAGRPGRTAPATRSPPSGR